MTNYFDKQGNYINCENLSLAEIYHRAFALGKEAQNEKLTTDRPQWSVSYLHQDSITKSMTGEWIKNEGKGGAEE